MALPLALELKRSELDPKKRKLEIDSGRVFYDGKTLECASVDWVKYGSLWLKDGDRPVFRLKLLSTWNAVVLAHALAGMK